MSYKITVIEDNEPDVFLLEDVLEQSQVDCTLKTVTDGGQARDYLRSVGSAAEAPDLILLDLNLPRISGTELLEHIRGNQALAQVPVVVWSSARSEREQKTLEAFNVARFIAKPTNYAAFLNIGPILKEILGASKAQSSK